MKKKMTILKKSYTDGSKSLKGRIRDEQEQEVAKEYISEGRGISTYHPNSEKGKIEAAVRNARLKELEKMEKSEKLNVKADPELNKIREIVSEKNRQKLIENTDGDKGSLTDKTDRFLRDKADEEDDSNKKSRAMIEKDKEDPLFIPPTYKKGVKKMKLYKKGTKKC